MSALKAQSAFTVPGSITGATSTLTLLQVDELSTQHRHHLAENAALAECQTLIQEAAKGWTATAGAAEAASEAALAQAGQEYMHAATRHLYYQRALLQLLLRQLTFCVNELQGMLQSIFGTITSFAIPAILLAASVCMDHNASHALKSISINVKANFGKLAAL